MTLRSLIWHNVKRNQHTYGSYFFSSLFSVLVFFIFALLFFHPQLQTALPSNSDTISLLAKFGLGAAQVVIVLLSFIFLWYSFANFLKLRKRDLAIYLMVGMSPKDLRKMLRGENLLIGCSASVLGVLGGILFSKVLLLLTENVMHLNGGLNFYFPTAAIALTLGIFFLQFLLISFFMTLKIETTSLTDLSKGSEKVQPLPQASPFWSIVGLLVLLSGYAALYFFVQGPGNNQLQLLLLLACVILTIIGTFLLLRQGSIWVLQLMKKRRKNRGGVPLLNLSEMIFQMRENATMSALIALTMSVAFVGIGMTTLLARYNQNTSNAPSFAYLIHPYDAEYDENYLQETTKKVVAKIQKAGYEATATKLTLPSFFTPENLQNTGEKVFWSSDGTFMKASEYNQLAQQTTDLPQLQPADDEIIYFANGLTEVNEIQTKGAKHFTANATLQTKTGEQTVRLKKFPALLNIEVWGLGVVADSLYQQLVPIEGEDTNPLTLYIIQYQEALTDASLSQDIETFLQQEVEKFHDQVPTTSTDTGSAEDSLPDTSKMFYLSSKYAIWQTSRQANGLLAMVGILLGSVFFVFAATILSFRLFGQLTEAGHYHRALNLLGVSEKMRHHLVTQQLLTMYFLPGLIACLHFAVAFWGVIQLGAGALNIWPTYFLLVGAYFTFQFLFFIISRKRYLKQLDVLAEE